MLKRQKGQVLILVLILLMVGALLIMPALNLSFTGLRSRMIYHVDLMEQYAADGATDYSLWRLTNESGFAASLPTDGTASPMYFIILNGIKAAYSVTAQAAASAPSDNLSGFTTNRYKITASVIPDYLPARVTTTFTYTITLQYMFPDVPTEPLTEVKVDLPSALSYEIGSTTGFTIFNPQKTGNTYRWNFTSAPISFNYYEIKTMSFRATGNLPIGTSYITVDVRTDRPRGSSGYTAPIVVVNPTAQTDKPRLSVTKTVFPTIIPPGVPTLLTYTINVKNLSSLTALGVQLIEDSLPAGFAYAGNDTGFLTYSDPGWPEDHLTISNGRWLLPWKYTPARTINPGDNVTGTFQAIGTLISSGNYANEVYVTTSPATAQEYTWPTGMVIVPQYDISTQVGGTTLRVNAQVSGGGHVIKSWQVE